MPTHTKNNGRNVAETLGTIVGILNFIMVVIMTFEAVVRFGTFLREWKPGSKKGIGFCRKPK
jgi:hypothetical protein